MYTRRCELEQGKVYVLHSTNEFGTMYKVVGFYGMDDYSDYNAVLQNVDSGWTFTAHGTNMYEDGTIDWDFSTNGRFER